MKMNQEVKIAALASQDTREAFLHYVKFFNLKGLGFLGGFQLSIDEKAETIKKIPAARITPKPADDGDHVIDVERYQNAKSGLPATMIDQVKKCLEYGN